jgi:hypothetical protein
MASAFTRGVSRRRFLGYSAALPLLFQEMAEAERKRVKIRDVHVMMLQGASRAYTLVRITADDGLHGIAEGWGSPGVAVKEQILSLKPWQKTRSTSTRFIPSWERGRAICLERGPTARRIT